MIDAYLVTTPNDFCDARRKFILILLLIMKNANLFYSSFSFILFTSFKHLKRKEKQMIITSDAKS